MTGLVPYIPIATTAIALAFSVALFRRWRTRGGPHLLWFTIGALTYAAGTITESYTTLVGWNATVFRLWYITGALLGGAPLAQGAVYLHLGRRTADRLAIALVAVVATGAILVALSPIDQSLVEPHRLTGRVLAWPWVRVISPFVNLYALAFLVGGAIISARRYAGDPATRHKFIGNVFIAIGAVLPGIGGSFTRFGHTEVLYVTEFLGLLLIITGYQYAIARPTRPEGIIVEV